MVRKTATNFWPMKQSQHWQQTIKPLVTVSPGIFLKDRASHCLVGSSYLKYHIPSQTDFDMQEKRFLFCHFVFGPFALLTHTAKCPKSHMGNVFFSSCKRNIHRTENTRDHNAFLVRVEWKVHEIFKTWSWDFILKYFNCQNRAVLVYFRAH